ncbi:MAG: hypothetical protein ACHQET_09945 [Chitinophagales bacterium]
MKKIVVMTSQHAYMFYEKLTFQLKQTKNDYWGPGLHLYELEMKN